MLTRELQNTLSAALNEAIRRDHGYVTLEHLLLSLLSDRTASDVIYNCGGDTAKLKKELEKFFKEHDDKLKRPQSRNQSELPEQTVMFERVLQYALLHAEASELKEINGGHILASMFQAERSHAVYLLKKQGINRLEVLSYISHGISKISDGAEPVSENESTEGPEDEAPPSRDPLKSFTMNLLERAADGQIDPLIGRAAELQRTIQI